MTHNSYDTWLLHLVNAIIIPISRMKNIVIFNKILVAFLKLMFI